MEADLYKFEDEHDDHLRFPTEATEKDQFITGPLLAFQELCITSRPPNSEGLITVDYNQSCDMPSLHEVVPGLFVGNEAAAYNTKVLLKHGVKAVVVCGKCLEQPAPHLVDYFAMEISDTERQEVYCLFQPATEFIHRALEKQYNVLVHCAAGISRSPTFAIAYLIRYREMPFLEAYELVRSVRSVSRPNQGFLLQLKAYSASFYKEDSLGRQTRIP